MNHTITFVLGVALILTSLALFLRRYLQTPAKPEQDHQPGRFHRMQAPATVMTGLVLGVLVAAASVGAGSLGTVALLILYPRL